MKTILKTALTAARRAGLFLQIRALETTVDGQSKALELVTCPITAYRIEIARTNTRAELARLRAEYNATFPAGIRRTWRMA